MLVAKKEKLGNLEICFPAGSLVDLLLRLVHGTESETFLPSGVCGTGFLCIIMGVFVPFAANLLAAVIM